MYSSNYCISKLILENNEKTRVFVSKDDTTSTVGVAIVTKKKENARTFVTRADAQNYLNLKQIKPVWTVSTIR